MRYVWGVDMAVSRLAFGFADMNSDSVECETLFMPSDATEGERLGDVYDHVQAYAFQAARRFPPHVIWVEQPSGRFRALQLVYATGVVQAALWDALEVPVWTLPSSKWKQRTVGRGNASKAQVAAWVGSQRFVFDGQDEADACAISFAGRELVVSRQWGEAA